MTTLLHLATQGSFLVSLPYLTLTSWVTLDSPDTPPQTWLVQAACLCSRGPCLLMSLPFLPASQALLTAPACKGGETLGHDWTLGVPVNAELQQAE